MGSTRDLEIIKNPTKYKPGEGKFHFQDTFSVFDWGGMPDTIPNKAEASCILGACILQEAGNNCINTHLQGLVNSEGKLVLLDELSEPTAIMQIYLFRVIKPEFLGGVYDYTKYVKDRNNSLIPFEFIYRNELPKGSSVFKRLEKGELVPADLGLDHYPEPGEKLPEPFFDLSTKFESKDRYLKWLEAIEMALDDSYKEPIIGMLSEVNDIVTEIAERMNLTNSDGKIELAIAPNGLLRLVDTFGLDECRLGYKDIPISKEMARIFYRDTTWYRAVERAKEEAKERKVENWRTLCTRQPPPLDVYLREIISQIYTSTTNEVTQYLIGTKFFDVPRLDDVIRSYEDWHELKQN